MDTVVCVLTGRGMSAIASVALSGPDAQVILKTIFRSTADKTLAVGSVCHGSIVDGHRVIDEVLIGCEQEDRFVIHCHGNPLLVEQIVRLCQEKGAVPVDAESHAYEQYATQSQNILEAEAKLAMQKSATLLGVKILQSQIDGGLSKWAADVQANLDAAGINEIQKQSREILCRSEIAGRIINGAKIVIAGPPNSGKSTLLNAFSGQQEVIVSDMAGTTRDWVSVTAQVGPLLAEFFDTAGLDEALAGKDDIEQTAQTITRDLLDRCDLIIYLQDAINNDVQAEIKTDKPVIYAVNKCDLVENLKPQAWSHTSLSISAKNNTGIDVLAETILNTLQVHTIIPTEPVAFTQRQQKILSQLISAQDKTAAKTCLEILLFGP